MQTAGFISEQTNTDIFKPELLLDGQLTQTIECHFH